MAGSKFTTKTVTAPLIDFSGGLNSTSSPLRVAENEATDLLNVDFDKFGAIFKRNGYLHLNSTAANSGATWTSLNWFETSSGTDYLMGTCGNKIMKMDSLDGTWDDITGGLTVTAGNNNRWDWATFKDTTFGTNNVDVPVKWTGTGNAAAMTCVTGLTATKCIESFSNYMFVANATVSGTKHSTRVYWSTINDPEAWNAADFNEIGFKDGQDIISINSLGDRLVIFKERSIWLAFFTGDTDIPFIFQRSQSPVGCDAQFSVQEIENGLIFHSSDGYYFFDGNNSGKISDKITVTLEGYSKSAYPNIVSVYQRDKNKYWSSYATSTTNNSVITFDSYNRAFGRYDGINANCFARVITSGDERIYFGDYAGYVYRADTGDDDYPSKVKTAINSYLYTKWFNYGDITDQKATPHVVIYYDFYDATLSFSWSYDLENGDTYTVSVNTSAPGSKWDSAVWDTDLWGSEGGKFYRVDLASRGRLIRYKFANNVISEKFKVNGLGISGHIETID